jgi:hypothetical protein
MSDRVAQLQHDLPAVCFREAITRQREMLTDLFSVPMFRIAQRMGPLIGVRNALEYMLVDELDQLPFCKYLYVLDVDGNQVTGNITPEGIDCTQYARNRARRSYMRDIIGISDFRLSAAYISQNNRRPSITAIQVIRDRAMQRVGFLGADFDLRELPHTGAIYRDLPDWRQLKGDQAIRNGLFNQQRDESSIDRKIDEVLAHLGELITGRGVFHAQLHFSSNRATVWLTDDPYHYRLLGVDELTNPDLCLACSPRSYPDTAMVPERAVLPVLETFRQLRFMDEHLYLRAGSLNIFNGTVGLSFSCDGSHYMQYREFLEKDVAFWAGMRCSA